MAKHDLIFYANRRTPEVVTKGQPGKKGGEGTAAGKVVKRRAATEREERAISSGNWLRVNVKGSTPSSSTYKSESKSKIRPQNN